MKKGGELVVKISDNFKKVILSNGYEHYMLNEDHQDNFPWIKDKFIRNVINHSKSFFLVTSKDYDRDIDILNSEDSDFNASLSRCIEPGLIKVYDSIIVEEICHDDHASSDARICKKGKIKTLINIGETLYLDTIDISKSFGDDPEDAHISTNTYQGYSSYGFNWPYFSVASSDNFIFVLNTFNP